MRNARQAALRRFKKSVTFRIDWSEYGDTARGVYATASDLWVVLCRISGREPEGGGYCKTHVTVLRDGRDWYALRMDVQRDGFDTDIVKHITTVHRFYQSEEGRRHIAGLPPKFRHRGTKARWFTEAFGGGL